MSKLFEVFLIKAENGRKAGETIRVHRQAARALISSGKGCDPKDAAKHRMRLGLGGEQEKRISFSMADGLPSKRGPSETKPKVPAETKPNESQKTSTATGVELAREALGQSFPQRKSACNTLGLEFTGTDDLLIGRLKAYIEEHS